MREKEKRKGEEREYVINERISKNADDGSA